MKRKLHAKTIITSAALFASAMLLLTGPMGCTTARQTQKVESHAEKVEAAQACRANLRNIAAAKGVWALENKKTDATVPTDADVFGPAKYIREKPTCPSGGTYTLGSVAKHPLCSIPGHTY